MSFPKKMPLGKNFLAIGLFILVVLAAIPSYYFYNKYQETQKLLKNPTLASAEQTNTLIEKVSKLIVLPKGESPTIATVSDKNKQKIFFKAENGDMALLYSKAGEAILYRPSIDKIIEVRSVNVNQDVPEPSVAPVAKIIKVALYNGTTTVGLTKSIESQLATKFPDIQVVEKANASKNDYAGTIVFDKTGKNKDGAKSLADLLNGKVGDLPDGEIETEDADIIIILGK